MFAPTGKDWENWRIGVYWDQEGEFYHGRVCDPEETAGLDQVKVAYDDGRMLSPFFTF